MEKSSLKKLMLALGCMSCLSSVALIKSAERVTEQKEANSRDKGSKRSMSVVFTEPENSKKIRPATIMSQSVAAPWTTTQKRTGSKPQKAGSRKLVVSLLPENAKKARQENITSQLASAPRAQSGSSQRKAGLRTIARSRPVPKNSKKARQEIEAIAPQRKAFVPRSDAASTDEIARLKKENEALSDMFRSLCLAAASKAYEQKNAELEADLAISREVVTSMALNAEEAREKALSEKALSDAETIEQLNKEVLSKAQTIKDARLETRSIMNALRKIPGSEKIEKIIKQIEFKGRMHRERRLDEANSR